MKVLYLLPILLLVSSCSIYFEPTFNLSNESRVYNVIDGDTLLLNGGEYVRLIGIDAPEKGSEGYYKADDFLRNLTEGKVVTLESEGSDRDRFGRLLRHVFVNGTNVAELLLEKNLVVIYDDYNGTYGAEFMNAMNPAE